MGPALLPHGPSLLAVAAALGDCDNQAVQEGASRLVSSVLVGLASFYPVQQYAPVPVSAEASILANAVAWADPATTADALVAPLLPRLQARESGGAGERDAAAAAASAGPLSKVAENGLKWRLGLLASAAYHMGPALLPHGPSLLAVAAALGDCDNQAVQEGASRLVSSVLVGLASFYPVQQYAPVPAVHELGEGLQARPGAAWQGRGRRGGGAGSAAAKWRRRRPFWLVAERAAYRWWVSLATPAARIDMLPPLALRLVSQVTELSVHPYTGVRHLALSLRASCRAVLFALAGGACCSGGGFPGGRAHGAPARRRRRLGGRSLGSQAAGSGRLPPVAASLLLCLAKAGAATVDFDRGPAQALPALQRAMEGAAAAAAAAGGGGQQESEQEQALASGAADMLRGRALWRLNAILTSALMFAFRFMRPPTAPPPAARAAAAAVLADLLAAARRQLPWRYTVLANSILTFFDPCLSGAGAADITAHFAGLLASDQMMKASPGEDPSPPPGVGAPAAGAARWGVPAEALAAAAAALRAATGADPATFAAGLFAQLAHGHSQLATAGAEGQQRARAAWGRDDAVVKAIAATLSRAAEWPQGRMTVLAIADGRYVAAHARLVQGLALVAPALAAHLRAPTEAALAQPQDEDRPATGAPAAAEVLTGLIASGAPFADAYELARRGDEGGLQALLDLLAEPLPAGANTALVCKRLSYIAYAATGAREQRGARETATVVGTARPTALLRRLQARLLGELPGLEELQGENVRSVAAQLACLVPCSILEDATAGATGGNGSGSSDTEGVLVNGSGAGTSLEAVPTGAGAEDAVLLVPASGRHLRQAAVAFLDRLVAQDVRALAVEDAAARAGAAAAAPGVAPAELVAAERQLAQQGESGGALMADDVVLVSAAQAAAEAGPGPAAGGGGGSGAAGLAGRSAAYRAAVARVAFSVEALMGGEGPVLEPWLVRMLGGLLRIQDLIPSELQFVSLAAKKALALLKYLPLRPAHVASALATLLEASRAELWAERASALIFVQYFWFR
eukprot:scaffold12.g8245.t1